MYLLLSLSLPNYLYFLSSTDGDSRSDVQRRLQNLSLGSPADVATGAAPGGTACFWPAAPGSGAAPSGNVGGRPLRGAHGTPVSDKNGHLWLGAGSKCGRALHPEMMMKICGN